MNADVEKAVGVITDHIADLTRCIGVLAAYPEMKPVASEFEKAMKELTPVAQALRDQEAENAELRKIKEERWAVVATRNAAVMRAEKANALLRECLGLMAFHSIDQGRIGEPLSLVDRITAHLGGEHV